MLRRQTFRDTFLYGISFHTFLFIVFGKVKDSGT